MRDSLDDFIRELIKQIHAETREAYGQVAFERWLSPRYMGFMDNPDGYGYVTGSCGDRMEIFLRFEEDKVKDAAFRTDGCGSSVVCGSYAAELALGKTPHEVAEGVDEKGRSSPALNQSWRLWANVKMMKRSPVLVLMSVYMLTGGIPVISCTILPTIS